LPAAASARSLVEVPHGSGAGPAAGVVRVALLVSGGVPNPTASGGAVTAWTILGELIARGHEVAVCVLGDPELYDPTSVDVAERVERVRGLGADVVTLLSGCAVRGGRSTRS
jgi:hypothetical protein